MSIIIGDLIKNTVGTAIGKALDHFLPAKMSEGEKAQFKASIIDDISDVAQTAEAELTKRHEADMKSDSWLSKNIRPSVLIYLMSAWTLLAVGSIKWSVDVAYITMLSDMLKAAFGFYFVSRGLEKIVKIVRDK